MTCSIIVLSHDRFPHLSLCLPRLLRSDLTDCHVEVIDDGSRDPRIHQLLIDLDVDTYYPELAEGTPQERIGIQRHRAVESFMDGKDDVLFLVDDDILLGPHALQDGLKALNDLTTNLGHTATLSLHGVMEPKTYVAVGPWLFGELRFGGEANVLIPRATIEKVGNLFSPEPRGFGDILFRALWDAGLGHYEICRPDPQVQHLGFGRGASVAYPQEGTQQWTHRPYTKHGPPVGGIRRDTPLVVDKFDVAYYKQCVLTCGGYKAPLSYLERKGPNS